MSEEEIIKKANLIIENHREVDKMMIIEMVDLVQGLLDLYNKEKEYAMGLYYDVQGLQQDLDKEKEKNKKIEDKIKGKINNLEIFRKTLPIRASEIERFIGELKDLLEE